MQINRVTVLTKATQPYDRSLCNDWIALSVNSCGKSFHIDSKEVFIFGDVLGIFRKMRN